MESITYKRRESGRWITETVQNAYLCTDVKDSFGRLICIGDIVTFDARIRHPERYTVRRVELSGVVRMIDGAATIVTQNENFRFNDRRIIGGSICVTGDVFNIQGE